MSEPRLRVGILATHPIQYYAPWYRALAREVDLEVFFSHKQTPAGQARAGFGVEFDWDVPLLDGYHHTFLTNRSRHPDVGRFHGCHTPEISRRIAEGRFDAFIVHGWATRSYWQAMIGCWRTGTPLIVRGDSTLRTPRPGWWRVLKTPLFRAFIPRFDAYLVVGERARAYLLNYGASPDRCFDAPHAVDNAFFAARSDALRANRRAVRKEWRLPEVGRVFLFAGRLVDMKHPMMFVDAMSRLSQRVGGSLGLIAGDGPLRAALEARAADLRAPVTFTGFLNQTAMVRAYAAADVFVLPSDARETWGLVVNEAMASGLPVVVSDLVGCAADLVHPGVTGETFRFGDVDDLVSRLERFVTDEAYLERTRAHAREHIAGWDVSRAASGTLAAIRSVQARRGRRTGSLHATGTAAEQLRRGAR